MTYLFSQHAGHHLPLLIDGSSLHRLPAPCRDTNTASTHTQAACLHLGGGLPGRRLSPICGHSVTTHVCHHPPRSPPHSPGYASRSPVAFPLCASRLLVSWWATGQVHGVVCTPQRSCHGGLRDSLVRAPTAHPPTHPTPIPHRLLVCVPSVRCLTPVLCALVGSRAALPDTVVVSTGSAPVVVVKLRTTHSRRHHGVQHTAQMGDRPRERGVRHRRR